MLIAQRILEHKTTIDNSFVLKILFWLRFYNKNDKDYTLSVKYKQKSLYEEDKDTHIGGGSTEGGAPIIDGDAPRMWWPQPR